MNSDPRARQRRFATAAAAAAALAALTLLVAACGSSSGNGTTAGTDSQQAALAYAQCMRANGLPDFPDPGPDGTFRGASHEQTQDNPKYQAAQEKCGNLAPGGEHEQNRGTPAFVAQARKFAQCMRANGLPDFPDPGPDGTFRGASHEQTQDNPKYQAALQTCQSKLPGGGAHQGP